MTILASGPGIIVCGSTGRVNRGTRDHPLPKGLGKYAGKPLAEVPTPELERYDLWLWMGGDQFEAWAVGDELASRVQKVPHLSVSDDTSIQCPGCPEGGCTLDYAQGCGAYLEGEG